MSLLSQMESITDTDGENDGSLLAEYDAFDYVPREEEQEGYRSQISEVTNAVNEHSNFISAQHTTINEHGKVLDLVKTAMEVLKGNDQQRQNEIVQAKMDISQTNRRNQELENMVLQLSQQLEEYKHREQQYTQNIQRLNEQIGKLEPYLSLVNDVPADVLTAMLRSTYHDQIATVLKFFKTYVIKDDMGHITCNDFRQSAVAYGRLRGVDVPMNQMTNILGGIIAGFTWKRVGKENVLKGYRFKYNDTYHRVTSHQR